MSKTLTRDQQKAILKSCSYSRGEKPFRRHDGRCIGFGYDHRGFGGIVAFPGDPARGFFIVNPQNLRPEFVGMAPKNDNRVKPRVPQPQAVMQPTLYFFHKGQPVRYGDGMPPRKV